MKNHLLSLNRSFLTQLLFFGAFFLALASSAPIQAVESPWVVGKAGASEVRLIADLDRVSASTQEIRLALEFKLKAGWHSYWKNPGLIGFPPKLQTKLPEGWKTELLFLAPERVVIPGKKDTFAYGYEKKTLYPIVAEGTPHAKNFEAEFIVDYLVCEIQCVPEIAKFSIQIPLDEIERRSKNFKDIDRAFMLLPVKASKSSYEFKSARELVLRIDQVGIDDIFIDAPNSAKYEFSKPSKISKSEWKITANQAFPNLEWTATFRSTKGRSAVTGAVTAVASLEAPQPKSLINIPMSNDAAVGLGLAFLLAFLGGLILNLMPCVLPVIGIKTLALLKLKEKKVAIRSSIALTIVGILTSFAGLAIMTIVLQNLGKQVGWGFQFQSPVFVAFMALLVFLFSLNMFGLFEFGISSKSTSAAANLRGSFFEGVFATLLATPCSAPFLGTALAYALSQNAVTLFVLFLVMGVGLAAPYILLLIAPSTLKILPKPGAWMHGLKRFLAYSLLAAVLFLLYILHAQTETLFLLAVLASLLLIFISLFEIKSLTRWVLVAILVGLTLYGAHHSSRAQAKVKNGAATYQVFTQQSLDRLLDEGQTVFVDITADWCITCKFNEKTVIETEKFQKMLAQKGVTLMIGDWTQRDDSISAFLKLYGRVGIPFAMIISKDKFVVLPELLTQSTVEKYWNEFFQK